MNHIISIHGIAVNIGRDDINSENLPGKLQISYNDNF